VAFLYIIPQSTDELLDIFDKTENRAILAAGTTALGRRKIHQEAVIADLSRLGLAWIRRDKNKTRIGAMTTAAEISASPEARMIGGGLLSAAAGQIGDPLIRNRVTIGGNIIQRYRWSHFPPALLALDARIHLLSREGERSIGVDDFFAQPARVVMKPGELLQEIEIPSRMTTGSFLRFSKTKTGFSIITLAIALRLERDEVLESRIAAGSIVQPFQRLMASETSLKGSGDTQSRISSAVEAALGVIKPTRSFQFSTTYRTEIFRVMLERELRRLLGGQ